MTKSPAPPWVVFLLASAVGVALVVGRFLVTGQASSFYLPWNLVLAWVPLGFAWQARRSAPVGSEPGRLTLLWSLGWLLFFPNAPYIFTDLMHLAALRPRATAPLWFDLVMHLLFASTGLMLGFASLGLMHTLVQRFYGPRTGWGFVAIALVLAGFGVYLGRFLRWNSWDLFRSPLILLGDVAEQVADPLAHPRTYGFSVLFGLFLLLTYLMACALAGFRIPTEERSVQARSPLS